MLYAFEDHDLDTDRRELRRKGDPVPVEPQVFDLLEYLIRSRERVVSKDELIEKIWEGRDVFESAVHNGISAARERLVTTVPISD